MFCARVYLDVEIWSRQTQIKIHKATTDLKKNRELFQKGKTYFWNTTYFCFAI